MKLTAKTMKLTARRGKEELLNDLQMLVVSLNDTINFIESGASKTGIEACLHCDGDLLNHICECLHNGGYDND